MDVDSAPPVDIPSAPVETPAAPEAPAEAPAAPETAAPEAPRDTFTAPATGGTPDADRVAAARDPNDGMDRPIPDSGGQSLWERINNGQQPGVEPAFYQGPAWYLSVPREGTHVGMTEDAGMAAGFNRNFTNYTADQNANVDHHEYGTDAAHSYNFSRDQTLQRAEDLGARMDAATTRYQNATTPRERQAAAQEMATNYGQYLHLLQDNRAHGGTDRAEHYGAHVDDNLESQAAARGDTRDAMTNLRTALQSRGINPMEINPGRRPGYSSPPWIQGGMDAAGAPPWDGQSRMWNRDEMARDIQNRFFGRLGNGNTAVPM